MSTKLCPFCMQMTEKETCPHCGKNINYTGSPAHLPAGYVVNGKHPYVLGAALGQGGFGITYIALDMVTKQRVAIKEYFPTYCSGRTDHDTVSAYQNQEEVYQKGKERFLDEARTLKSLSDLENIVNVLDFFEANNSAYLVMEFLDGDSLKQHAAKYGKFPAQQFLNQIRPLMEDIHRMHERGVIHRDIAPDNIILLPDGQMKLIDFGAARSYVGEKSMTVVVKKGFAPVEQYFSTGSTASSDVYALAATIYYCITGVVPPDSVQRQNEDIPLATPISLGADITPKQEKALFKALDVLQKSRIQNVREFHEQLLAKKSKKAVKLKPKKLHCKFTKADPLSQKKLLTVLATVTTVLVVLTLAGFFTANSRNKTVSPEMNVLEPNTPAQETISTSQETAVSSANSPEVLESNLLMADPNLSPPHTYTSGYPVFGSTINRGAITSITFLDTLINAPETSWDVSYAQDGSVLAWINNGCDLYIAGNGEINASDCTKLFSGYSNLNHIQFNNNFNTKNVTSMEGMFHCCKSLTSVDISQFETTNVTDMNHMFYGCSSLKSVDWGNCDTSHVTNMHNMFKLCSNLKNISVGNNFDISNVEDHFGFMGSGSTINGKPWEEFFVKTAEPNGGIWQANILMKNPHTMFMGISKNSITSITFVNTFADAPENAWDVSEAQNRSVLAWTKEVGQYYNLYIAGNGGINAINACQGLFLSYSQLQNVDFNNCFYTEEVTSMSQMFYGCENLISVNLDGINTSNVTDMSDMFYRCSNLKKLNVSAFDVSNVTDMSYMFAYCSNLAVLDVSIWNTSNVTDMSHMFRACCSMTELDVSRWNTSNVTDMSYMFLQCSNLIDLDLSGFDTSKVENYEDFMTYYATINGRPWKEFFE